MTKTLFAFVVLGTFLFLLGCAGFTSEQKQSITEVLSEMLTAGTISQQQYDAFISALGGNKDWWAEIVKTGGTIIGSAALGLLGIQKVRGPSASQQERANRVVVRAKEKAGG